MSELWPRQLDDIARLVVDLGAAPGAVVAASAGQGAYWRRAVGAHGSLWPGGPAVAPSSVFDLASVTKPFVALSAARLARRRPDLWSTPLGRLLAEARGTPSESVTLDLLLAHRAGLDAHRPLYAPLVQGTPVARAEALREAAGARRDDCPGAPPVEGFAPLYSDLGYLLAGAALERASGRSLGELIAQEVTVPIGGGIASSAELHERGLLDETAPTEVVDWRGGAVRGEVHDENAWAIGGRSVCGHAGLFGDAAPVARLGEWLVEALIGERAGWLTPDELHRLVRPRPGGTLRAGFDSKSASGSSAGSHLGPRSFGHLGFTGTSLWVDPDRPLVVVLLTNRVHPTRVGDAIRRARPAVHDAVAAWAARLLVGRSLAGGFAARPVRCLSVRCAARSLRGRSLLVCSLRGPFAARPVRGAACSLRGVGSRRGLFIRCEGLAPPLAHRAAGVVGRSPPRDPCTRSPRTLRLARSAPASRDRGRACSKRPPTRCASGAPPHPLRGRGPWP